MITMIMINREELVRGRRIHAESTQCIQTRSKDALDSTAHCSRPVMKLNIRTEGA